MRKICKRKKQFGTKRYEQKKSKKKPAINKKSFSVINIYLLFY